MGAFIRQVDGRGWRVSLRSRGSVDVRRIAERFGGGGHEKAAGCGLEGELDEVVDRVVSEMEEALR
jgi:phosphoesterase RecJ-like protein